MSAPHRVAHVILSTSSSMEEVTAELPMLALILTRKRRPMTIGSVSGWLTLAGSTARPAATSSRTNSAATPSRSATNSISGVIWPRRAYASWVTAPAGRPGAGLRPTGEHRVEVALVGAGLQAVVLGAARPAAVLSVSRALGDPGARSAGRPGGRRCVTSGRCTGPRCRTAPPRRRGQGAPPASAPAGPARTPEERYVLLEAEFTDTSSTAVMAALPTSALPGQVRRSTAPAVLSARFARAPACMWFHRTP